MVTFIPLVIISSLLIGTCVQAGGLSDPEYAAHVSSHYGLVVPENEGKFWYIKAYGWQPMDEIVTFAQDHNLQVHYHTLLWWYSLPDDPCEWIQEAMSRYPTITDWDVVNEAWTASGPTSDIDIPAAYRCARAARPDARLWYNGIFDSQREIDGALALMREGLADGIGIQMHLVSDSDITAFAGLVESIEELGGAWRVSELDVRLELPASQADLNRQRGLYYQVSALCHKSHACQSITVWGASDAYSWIPGQWPGWGAATAFGADYQSKVLWEELGK